MPIGFAAFSGGNNRDGAPTESGGAVGSENAVSSGGAVPPAGQILDTGLSRLAAFRAQFAEARLSDRGFVPETDRRSVRENKSKRESELNAYVADFLLSVQSSVLSSQHRLLEFALSRDPHPEEKARELLSLISCRSETFRVSLQEYQKAVFDPANRMHLSVDYDGGRELFNLTTNPARILGRVLSEFAKVTSHLTPLVSFPGGRGAGTTDAFVRAKEVASNAFQNLGEVIAGEQGLAVTISGLRNRSHDLMAPR